MSKVGSGDSKNTLYCSFCGTSKIASNAETSDVTMVLDEGSVKELAAAPPPSSDVVPVTEANRQGSSDVKEREHFRRQQQSA
jgi:hypothetical protein